MTAILLAANAAWMGLVIALWTKRLWETSVTHDFSLFGAAE